MAAELNAILAPWFEALMDEAGRPDLFDAHTHFGQNDPDTFRQTPEELLADLELIDARGLVFPMHEPDGYRAANRAVLEAAAASGGRLTALCRVQPRDGDEALAEARRCLDAGAAGIKLHPRAEAFGMEEPVVADLMALAHERRAVVLMHAGRGIPALGANTITYAERFPDARLILAHCAISDLAWLVRELPSHPNVYIDTAWWHPADILGLFCLAPPGQILWASDSPYGLPLHSAIMVLRCALEAGLTQEQLASVFGGQVARLVRDEDALDLGPAPGPSPPLDPLLERVVANLTAALGCAIGGADPTEPLGLARLAAGVGDAHPQADVFAAVLRLLDLFEEHDEPPPPGRRFSEASRLVVIALVLARTPRAALAPEISGRAAGASHAHAERGETAS